MSFEDPFKYFELDRNTASASDVKRAYARKLKVARPDDDPAEFMRLRQHFDSALRSIKWRDEDRANGYHDDYEDEPDDTSEKDSVTGELPLSPIAGEIAGQASAETVDQSEAPAPVEPPPENVPSPPSGANWSEDHSEVFEDDIPAAAEQSHAPGFVPDDQTLVTRTIDQIRTLMDDAEKRQNWEEWYAILDDELLDGIDTFQLLSFRLRNLVCQETSPDQGRTVAKLTDRISPSILLNLDDRFGWSKQTGTDWVTRNENLWISRLVETAAIATGRQSITPWEKAQRELRAKSETQKPSRFSQKTERMVTIAWIVARIALILLLINLIGYLLQD